MMRIDLAPNDRIRIGGNVVVTLEYKSGQRARLAIDAPREVRIEKEGNVSPVIKAARGGIVR